MEPRMDTNRHEWTQERKASGKARIARILDERGCHQSIGARPVRAPGLRGGFGWPRALTRQGFAYTETPSCPFGLLSLKLFSACANFLCARKKSLRPATFNLQPATGSAIWLRLRRSG